METRNCDDCKHFKDEDIAGARVCEKNHKPRWYAQKNDNPHDTDYGYKRKCGDYEATAKVDARKTVIVTRKMLTAAHGATTNGNSNWRPLVPNAIVRGGSDGQ